MSNVFQYAIIFCDFAHYEGVIKRYMQRKKKVISLIIAKTFEIFD